MQDKLNELPIALEPNANPVDKSTIVNKAIDIEAIHSTEYPIVLTSSVRGNQYVEDTLSQLTDAAYPRLVEEDNEPSALNIFVVPTNVEVLIEEPESVLLPGLDAGFQLDAELPEQLISSLSVPEPINNEEEVENVSHIAFPQQGSLPITILQDLKEEEKELEKLEEKDRKLEEFEQGIVDTFFSNSLLGLDINKERGLS